MKKVHFSKKTTVYLMNDWPEESREARKSYWMQIALNRRRFKKRIEKTAKLIEWCLTSAHRAKISSRVFFV